MLNISINFKKQNIIIQRRFYQLNPSHVFLPPKIFFVFRTQSRDQIIRIHDNVYQRIQENDHSTLLAWQEFDIQP